MSDLFNYHPIVPDISTEPDEYEKWLDVAPAHFSDPEMWLHRQKLKEIYSISERSYFRWLTALKKFGLNRTRNARENWKVKLFYKKDVEEAFHTWKTATVAHGKFPEEKIELSKQKSVDEPVQNDQTAVTEQVTENQPEAAKPTLKEESEKHAPELLRLQQTVQEIEQKLEQYQKERQKDLEQLTNKLLEVTKQQALIAKLLETKPAPQNSATDFYSKALETVVEFARSHEQNFSSAINNINQEIVLLRSMLESRFGEVKKHKK
ncbi:MAG: hypothetical protein JNN15_13470 [Blastocatellia bacterium]|nr:hypothetical protein [Blastocatellia bacterium]